MTDDMCGDSLDELVAERVFKWTGYTGCTIPTDLALSHPGHISRIWVKPDGSFAACSECGTLPPFSTDILTSLQIVDLLRKGSRFEVMIGCFENRFTVEVRKWRNLRISEDPTIAFRCKPTLPHALCRAALQIAHLL